MGASAKIIFLSVILAKKSNKACKASGCVEANVFLGSTKLGLITIFSLSLTLNLISSSKPSKLAKTVL